MALGNVRRATILALLGLTAAGLAAGAAAQEVTLPATVVWSAYGTGSSGYNQAIAIGQALQDRLGVTLRVLPGKTDVARLTPLRSGKAQFAATGSDAIYAQEALYSFGTRNWGPQPIRLLAFNVGDGATVAFATRKRDQIARIAELKGRRVAWVAGEPALNQAALAMLRFGGLTWDDVIKVEVAGYRASAEALIRGEVDAFEGATHSSVMIKLEAAPVGLAHIPLPHDDTAGWARLKAVAPWYLRQIATRGVGLPRGGQELATTAYPNLVGMAGLDEAVAYNMTKAIHAYFDDYKNVAPGAAGWALDRQRFAEAFLPYHPGAVRYYREIGVWTAAHDAVQAENLRRQQVIAAAWKAHKAAAPADAAAFDRGWMAARHAALSEAGLNPVFREW